MAVQWHAVFNDALRASDVIAVRIVVERFLGRPPTLSEASAARRAANRYATVSNIQLLRIAAPVSGRANQMVLMLARPDADLGDPSRLIAIAAGQPVDPRRRHQGRGTRNVSQRAESLIATLTKSAKTAQSLSTADLDPAHAAALAHDLAAVLPELVQLHDRLQLRGGMDRNGHESTRPLAR